jgi:hypothetical protein
MPHDIVLCHHHQLLSNDVLHNNASPHVCAT